MSDPNPKSEIRNPKCTGTREWSEHSANCCLGCSHGCLYCYARFHALRFKRIASAEEWTAEKLLPLPKRVSKHDGPASRGSAAASVVMFPTTHDITPGNLDHCLAYLRMLLRAGNQVLIVSKPHPRCMDALALALDPWRHLVEFRFSITANIDQPAADGNPYVNRETAAFWEPGAPSIAERIACLRHAQFRGYETSVSMEPLLDACHAVDMVGVVSPFVTRTIWIGKANYLRARTAWLYTPDRSEDVLRKLRAETERIEAGQTDQAVMKIRNALKDNPKIRWKDSYREVIERSAGK